MYRRTKNPQGGFTLIETLFAATFLAIALMAHASTSISNSHLLRSEERNGAALRTMRQVVERLRSDVEWSTLYDTLRQRMDVSPATPIHPPSAFFSDFDVPTELGEVRILIAVPRALPPAGGTVFILREDVSDPAFGLPYDLNGDGTLDTEARDDDYHALPVNITLEWHAPGDAPQQMRVSVWLRGERA